MGDKNVIYMYEIHSMDYKDKYRERKKKPTDNETLPK
jgi:hypothetical protein